MNWTLHRYVPGVGRLPVARFTGAEAIAGASVVGGVLGGLGQIGGGQSANSAAIANATILNSQANVEQQQGDLAYQRDKRQGLIYRGQTLAGFATSGVDASQGSPLDVLAQLAKETEFKAEEDRFSYYEKAWEMRMGAQTQRMAGSAAASSGTASGISSILGGVIRGGSLLWPSGGGGASTGTNLAQALADGVIAP